MWAFRSPDGGASWTAATRFAAVTSHTVRGQLRTEQLPSAEIDGAGTVFVAWQDCRFRAGCAANDIVLASSADGVTWTRVQRVPIDPASSAADHFIPGLGVDRGTSGASAHLALAYYFYPDATCASGCRLKVGFITSRNAGATWSAPTVLAGPMALADLPNTSDGRMVGDYISTSVSGGAAVPVFAVAKAHAGTTFDEAMYAPFSPLPIH